MIRALPLTLLAACPGPPECEAGAPTAALGTGDVDFVPIAEGDTIPLYYGAQGGVHVYGSVRVTGLAIRANMALNNPDTPKVTFQVRDGDGDVIGGYAQLPRQFRRDGDAWSLVGEQLILDLEEPSAGMPLTLDFSATDACEANAAASIGLMLGEP